MTRPRLRRLPARLTALVLAALLGGLATGSVAQGASNGEWAVQPITREGTGVRDNFSYVLNPGQTIRDTVAVTNLTDREKTFLVYPADAYNTSVDGAFALIEEGEPSEEAGSWITVGVNEVVIPPTSRAEINFEIQVPENAEPGDHAAGVIAADVEPEALIDEEGASVEVKRRVAARVYIRVPGDLNPSLQVQELGVAHSDPLLPYLTGANEGTVGYRVHNDGNVRLQATAEVKIKSVAGFTLKTFEPEELPELLPGGSVVVEQPWSSVAPLGPMRVEVKLTAQDDYSSTHTKMFWIVPWLYLLILVALVAAWYALRRWRRGRRARAAAGGPGGSGGSGGAGEGAKELVTA